MGRAEKGAWGVQKKDKPASTKSAGGYVKLKQTSFAHKKRGRNRKEKLETVLTIGKNQEEKKTRWAP